MSLDRGKTNLDFDILQLSPSRRREAPCGGTNSPPAIYTRGKERTSEV
jgi:hypothetical protein